ncbi:YhgE/Pip domain-containing protein [Candidatus Stoquefichus sp. SB1]|uniref:YhgE/Pip domain-containing protein n=1 Tax=Candidatus Stoquefichus sp. SB1 TaxID=1658109 RepID=UPI00067F36AF|nr:YhgE/Pip domain-containing protein [Candidatus Stoquefichus sp. SB1]
MVKQEWKNVFHNTWIKIVMVAVIAIPSIYSCVFLGSMWDPYGNSGSIPVAVVNEDKEVTYNDSLLNVGEELVKNLEDNESMDFHFVNAQNAMKGLENGDYYMIITIPQDFSKNATTLLDNQPQKMIINYTTNPGTNYIASKMDDSAIAKIKAEISSSVTKTYAQTIFDSIGVLSDGLGEASDGTDKLSDGVHQLVNGNQTISDNLKVLASSSLTFKDGANTLTKGLKDYTDGVLTVDNGVYTLKDGLDTLNSSTGALSTGIQELNTGSQALKSGLTDYTDGVSKAYLGTQQLVSNNPTLMKGVQDLGSGTKQISSANKLLLTKIQTLSESMAKELEAKAQDIAKLEAGNQELSEKLNGLKNVATSSQEQNNALIAQIENDTTMDKDLKTQILTALKTSNGINDSLLSEDGVITTAQYLAVKNNEAINELSASIQSVLDNLNAQGKTPETMGMIQALSTMQAGLDKIDASVNGGTYQTVNDKNEVVNVNIAKEKSLVYGVNAYVKGTENVNNGLATITSNNQKLTSGSTQLAQGTNLLVKQTPTLVSGIKALDTGASQIYMGTTQLVSHNQTLLNGADQLNGGAGQISSGASQLADGSKTLGSGLDEVNDGVQTLNSRLKDGADQSKMNTTNSTIDMLSTPVDTTHNEISVVENNGHAMAPYMMSVALYVTALAFVLMYPIRHGIKNAENGWKYWLSKASVMYSISTIAAIVMITCLRVINGFEPQQLLLTYLFAILVAAAYMSIVILLSMTTGYIGDFLLLVFMIINLGGSAGTYPLETSSVFYKAIHAFMPYTYSVNGFRKVISMASASLTTEIWVFIGIFIVCSLLTILYFQIKNKEDKHLIPQAFENVNEEK